MLRSVRGQPGEIPSMDERKSKRGSKEHRTEILRESRELSSIRVKELIIGTRKRPVSLEIAERLRRSWKRVGTDSGALKNSIGGIDPRLSPVRGEPSRRGKKEVLGERREQKTDLAVMKRVPGRRYVDNQREKGGNEDRLGGGTAQGSHLACQKYRGAESPRILF